MSSQSYLAPRSINCAGRLLDLSTPKVMGILNVTPDSFSDGGALHCGGSVDLDLAVRRAQQMVADGAAIIDVGGESTRPGAAPVSVQQELDRVLPVVEALVSRVDTIVSVDTSTAVLMTEAAALGAGLINDVRALQRDGALLAAAQSGLPVCLMHMQGEPATMQNLPSYHNVFEDVAAFLRLRADAAIAAGVRQEHILLDPGFGFGKSLQHNFYLLNRLAELSAGVYPVLVGLSRKSMVGQLLGREVNDRLAGSLALAVTAVNAGASVVRVHDVRETVDAICVANAVASSGNLSEKQ